MAIDTAQAPNEVYPLSALQGNLFACNHSGAKPGQDIEQIVGDLREDLDAETFAAAWQAMVRRHPALRSSFVWHDSQPRQEIHRELSIPLTQIDWRGWPAAARDQAWCEWLKADRLQGFNLSQPPLARAALFRFDDSWFRFVWTFHHALLDATSFAIVIEELFACYEALSGGTEPSFSRDPGYGIGLETAIHRERDDAQIFWKELLQDFEPPDGLGISKLFRESSDHEETYGEQTEELPAADLQPLRDAARREGVTLSTMLYASWALLLSRYAGVEDIVFGTVHSGRHDRQTRNAVGLLINTVPLRVRSPRAMSVSRWLQEIRGQQTRVRPYIQTPLLNILEWAGAGSKSPVFETIVNFQDPAWHDRLRQLGPRWQGRQFRAHNQPGYPLWLDAWAGEGLKLRIGYYRSKFEDATIVQMLGHLRNAMSALANAGPETPVGTLELMTRVEREQVLCFANGPSLEMLQPGLVQDWVAEAAERIPEALAVSAPGKSLSYGELNHLANRLAHFLKSIGAGPGRRVAVCLPRSAELVVAELAVLKAGAAFVPLDPAYPCERLQYMLEDSGALAVLTAESGVPVSSSPLKTIPLNLASPGEWHRFPSTNPEHNCERGDLAYVIYTSGSSGRPKGVAIEHQGLANLVTWHATAYGVSAEDRATLLASPAFDASVWEIWPYLASAASLWIPDEEIRLSPGSLMNWLSSNRITVAFVATPIVEAALDVAWPSESVLRAVLTGGERLHRRPPSGFGRPLINHYGPTECTVVATAGLVEPSGKHPPSIGRPIANTRTYCLDAQLRLLPVGVAGELCVSGFGVGRGYLNKAQLSDEKFVQNPYGAPGYERMYRTGDRVRWLSDGTLEFLGRIDHQIKIRGQRVELDEIETVLAEHPDVRAAAVKAHATEGRISLAAYVVPSDSAAIGIPEVRAWLAKHLPQHMRPETVDFLSALPVTPSGKVDRAALKAEEPKQAAHSDPPRNPVEEIVAGVWSEVLGRSDFGRRDNFFELGGDSIQAMQVTSRLGNIFEVELAIHCLFEAPTISGLAERMARSREELQSAAKTVVVEAASQDSPVTSFAQERLWFLEQLEPGIPLHNVPFALELCGRLDRVVLERSLNEIGRRHQPLRTVFTSRDGQLMPRERALVQLPLPLTDLSRLSGEPRDAEARRMTMEHARVPFDLSEGPLLKARLVRLAPEHHLLLLTMHLIASDGWSVSVFYKELAQLYGAFSCGHPSPLPPLRISYSDFARVQRHQLSSERLKSLLTYWRKQLGDRLEAQQLPTDFPRPSTQTFNGAAQFFALPAPLSQTLKTISRREDVTLFMLLLAGFKTLLKHYSGAQTIVVGSPIAGRTLSNTDDLIGAFVNTLVLRTDLTDDLTFPQLLGRIRTTCLGAYQHQDLPLEKLVDALQPRRDPSRHPLFQVMFTFQNAPLHPLELADLKLKPLSVDAGVSKFDLSLLLEETSQGLGGCAEYNTDLFTAATITQLLASFQTLLERIAADPGQRLTTLTGDLSPWTNTEPPTLLGAPRARSQQRKEKTMQTERVPLRPGLARRKALRMDAEEMVSIKPLFDDHPAPILLEAKTPGLGLPDWARSHKERLEQLLMQHRALLFRNFGIQSVEQFQESVLATCSGDLLNYVDRSTPRPSVGNKVYVSTIYPSAETIQMHNEGTYWRTWPLKIYFCSLVTAEAGGETPIADVRKVLQRLTPEVREIFQRKQISYVRNYNDGFGLPWQETFQTRDKSEVEAYCRANDIQFEWKEGDRLRTRQTRPAIRTHPLTGESVWFNHGAFFHITSLASQVRDELLAAFPEEDLPYNTYYGDGTPIEPEIVAQIREAYAAEKLVFPWKNGDVMLLDNMSMAHGRQPYQGRREVVVSMAEPYREN